MTKFDSELEKQVYEEMVDLASRDEIHMAFVRNMGERYGRVQVYDYGSGGYRNSDGTKPNNVRVEIGYDHIGDIVPEEGGTYSAVCRVCSGLTITNRHCKTIREALTKMYNGRFGNRI